MKMPGLSRVNWDKTYRLVNSCYPPCNVWEDIISNPEDWEMAYKIECLTNPRVRNEIGQIHLIPKERMIMQTNSWWVTSAFTHINPEGGRFNTVHFGVYYAANQFMTALKEKAFGLTRQFLSDSAEPAIETTCRVFLGKIDANLHDVRDQKEWLDCYYDADYTQSQKLAVALRDQDSDGIVYKSVRDPKGDCFGAFWPDVVSIPTQERHVVLHWDGEKVNSYYEIRDQGEKWLSLN